MKSQMFQFIFISMVFYYGVEMNGYKTTGNIQRSSDGNKLWAIDSHAQITRRHTQLVGPKKESGEMWKLVLRYIAP